MIDTLNQFYTNYSTWFYWLAILSALLIILSILLIPILVARIPQDYFSATYNPIIHNSIRLSFIRNLIGSILIVAGILMLFLPGQGLLTILIGIFISNFPGKYKLEYYLITQPTILKSVNWIRRKKNVPELSIDR